VNYDDLDSNAGCCELPTCFRLCNSTNLWGTHVHYVIHCKGDMLLGTQVGKTTSFFANTPDQYAGRLDTEKFTAYWKANETDWVPNAALVRIFDLFFLAPRIS
jgi:hypothetical protein